MTNFVTSYPYYGATLVTPLLMPCKTRSPEDDQSILIEMSSCNLQFFSELITTQN